MLKTLLSPGYDGDGKLANDFLSELGKTVPLESLSLLLTSANERTRATGAFLATFQDRNINAMIGDLAGLLDDAVIRTRFDAAESIWSCSGRDDGEFLGRALLHLDDNEAGPRWGAIRSIQCHRGWKLQLACKHAAQLRPNSSFSTIFEIYSDYDRNYECVSPTKVKTMLGHADALVRRFGLGLAGQPQYVVIDRFVEWAQASPDPEISGIAGQWFEKSLLPYRAVWQSAFPVSAKRQSLEDDPSLSV
jgi:hypothetical protein